jgi:hypothetical protein
MDAARRVAVRLRARRGEIEQAIATRVYALAEPPVRNLEYAQGLQATLSAGVDYLFATIEHGGVGPSAVPTVLLTQARLAARHRVGLDVVLRRYFAAYSLLTDFTIEESERTDGVSPSHLQTILRGCAAVLDDLVAAVTEEYRRERGRAASVQERRTELVRRLLAGERVDSSDLAYQLDCWHVAAIASGPSVPVLFRGLATALDRRLLLIATGDLSCAAWLGGESELDRGGLLEHLAGAWPAHVPLALGEPAFGLTGWRLTYRQAGAALPVVARSERTFSFYADVALPASALLDDLLCLSLRRLYLDPLEQERDAAALYETLRAYLRREQNISSAAAALGVSRGTITNRLRRVEARLGRPLHTIVAELEIALRLRDLQTHAQG